jgi:hypothetical protein
MEIENAAEVMEKVIKQIRDATTLHVAASLESNFRFLDFVNLRLGPGNLEVWCKNSQWRLNCSVGRHRGIVISAGESETYLFKNGRWERTRLGITDKLWLFSLDSATIARISYTSLEEGVLNDESVWIVHGIDNSDRSHHIWWVGKKDFAVKKFQKEGGDFEFEYAGIKRRVQWPVTFIMRFETVEVNGIVPDELFQIPRDVAPEGETEEWFDKFEDVFDMLLRKL